MRLISSATVKGRRRKEEGYKHLGLSECWWHSTCNIQVVLQTSQRASAQLGSDAMRDKEERVVFFILRYSLRTAIRPVEIPTQQQSGGED